MNDNAQNLYKEIKIVVEKALDGKVNPEQISICLLAVSSSIALDVFDDVHEAENKYIKLSQNIWNLTVKDKEEGNIIEKVEEILQEGGS